jgi:hypothetical protein
MGMDESSLRSTAVLFLLTTVAMLPIMLFFVIVSFYEEAYAESAFLMGVSFILTAQLVYYYERAFTPGEIWRTVDGFMVRRIGERSVKNESASNEEQEPSQTPDENQ